MLKHLATAGFMVFNLKKLKNISRIHGKKCKTCTCIYIYHVVFGIIIMILKYVVNVLILNMVSSPLQTLQAYVCVLFDEVLRENAIL